MWGGVGRVGACRGLGWMGWAFPSLSFPPLLVSLTFIRISSRALTSLRGSSSALGVSSAVVVSGAASVSDMISLRVSLWWVGVGRGWWVGRMTEAQVALPCCSMTRADTAPGAPNQWPTHTRPCMGSGGRRGWARDTHARPGHPRKARPFFVLLQRFFTRFLLFSPPPRTAGMGGLALP